MWLCRKFDEENHHPTNVALCCVPLRWMPQWPGARQHTDALKSVSQNDPSQSEWSLSPGAAPPATAPGPAGGGRCWSQRLRATPVGVYAAGVGLVTAAQPAAGGGVQSRAELRGVSWAVGRVSAAVKGIAALTRAGLAAPEEMSAWERKAQGSGKKGIRWGGGRLSPFSGPPPPLRAQMSGSPKGSERGSERGSWGYPHTHDLKTIPSTRCAL